MKQKIFLRKIVDHLDSPWLVLYVLIITIILVDIWVRTYSLAP